MNQGLVIISKLCIGFLVTDSAATPQNRNSMSIYGLLFFLVNVTRIFRSSTDQLLFSETRAPSDNFITHPNTGTVSLIE